MLKRQPGWDMVLLEIDTDGAVEPFYSHTLFAAGRPVGVVTSGAFGHRTRKSLALAFLRERDMREGLAVKMLGVERPARILAQPPYDPQNLKLKA
jgi:dimethylglycine dehydrogenase